MALLPSSIQRKLDIERLVDERAEKARRDILSEEGETLNRGGTSNNNRNKGRQVAQAIDTTQPNNKTSPSTFVRFNDSCSLQESLISHGETERVDGCTSLLASLLNDTPKKRHTSLSSLISPSLPPVNVMSHDVDGEKSVSKESSKRSAVTAVCVSKLRALLHELRDIYDSQGVMAPAELHLFGKPRSTTNIFEDAESLLQSLLYDHDGTTRPLDLESSALLEENKNLRALLRARDLEVGRLRSKCDSVKPDNAKIDALRLTEMRELRVARDLAKQHCEDLMKENTELKLKICEINEKLVEALDQRSENEVCLFSLEESNHRENMLVLKESLSALQKENRVLKETLQLTEGERTLASQDLEKCQEKLEKAQRCFSSTPKVDSYSQTESPVAELRISSSFPQSSGKSSKLKFPSQLDNSKLISDEGKHFLPHHNKPLSQQLSFSEATLQQIQKNFLTAGLKSSATIDQFSAPLLTSPPASLGSSLRSSSALDLEIEELQANLRRLTSYF